MPFWRERSKRKYCDWSRWRSGWSRDEAMRKWTKCDWRSLTLPERSRLLDSFMQNCEIKPLRCTRMRKLWKDVTQWKFIVKRAIITSLARTKQLWKCKSGRRRFMFWCDTEKSHHKGQAEIISFYVRYSIGFGCCQLSPFSITCCLFVLAKYG